MRHTIVASALAALLWATPAFATNTNDAVFTSTANKNLQASDSASISVTGALTVQFAVKFTGTPTDTQGLIGNYSAAGATDRAFFCQRGATVVGDEKILCGVFSGGSSFTVSSSALAANTWYCVAFKYIPSTSITMYLDANCDAPPVQDGQNTTSIPASLNDSTANFTLGAYTAFTSSAANVFNGNMDDVRIWSENHTFTTDYNCDLSGSETNLKAYWKLNNSLADATANGNTLTNTGSVTINDTSVPWSSDCASAGASFYTTDFWWLFFS